jgi:hypothetical protein
MTTSYSAKDLSETLEAKTIREMREHLYNCGADDAQDRDDAEVIAAIDSTYEGGVAQFIADGAA